MLTASNARNNTISSEIVETELALINLNILYAVSQGRITASVTHVTNTSVMGTTLTGTPMTLNTDTYLVWQNRITDNLITAQMAQVIDYYSQLGYTISRKTIDGTHLLWQISW